MAAARFPWRDFVWFACAAVGALLRDSVPPYIATNETGIPATVMQRLARRAKNAR